MDRVMISRTNTHSLETIWGPVSSSLFVSCEPLQCCGPSTCSSSVWWDGYQRTSLDKHTEGYKQAAVRETTVTVPGWDQIRASSSKMQQIPCNNSCSESSARVRRLTVHLSHGSHVIIWIFEAHKTVAFGFSSPFVSDHLVTHTVMMSCYPPTGDTRHFHREVD